MGSPQSRPRSGRVDSSKAGIVAADVRRLTLKKANGTEPPYVGCYGFLNRPCLPALNRSQSLTELRGAPTIHCMSDLIYPRSPRETMCGWTHLPRYIDKIRLHLAG